MFTRTAKLFSTLALFSITGLCLAADKPDPAKTFAKDFAPVLTKVTINDKVLFEDGKKQTEKITIKSDKTAVIKYYFKNTGSMATTIPGRIFVHFCNLKNKYLMGGDFNPNPPTTKWDKDFSATFTRKINLKKLKGQGINMLIGIYFPGKGKGQRLVMKNTNKGKRIPVGTFTVE